MYGPYSKKIGQSTQRRTSSDAQRTIVLKRPPRITPASILLELTFRIYLQTVFSLEGEEDFEPDRSWKRNHPDSDDDSDDSTSDCEENRSKRKRIHWVINYSVDAPEEYDNGEDDDEEDDNKNDERQYGQYAGV